MITPDEEKDMYKDHTVIFQVEANHEKNTQELAINLYDEFDQEFTVQDSIDLCENAHEVAERLRMLADEIDERLQDEA
jgi:hypothetical protein